MYKGSRSAGAAMTRAGTATRIWGQGTDVGRAIRNPLIKASVRTNGTASKALNTAQGALRGVSNNTIARIGAGAVGAGLAAASAKNAYRAATAQKKAQQFKSEMNKAFKGTQYANGNSQPRQGGKKRRRR